ncbi:MAG: hypothetical protein HZA48_12615 [Planctomycetes bacterium]|nr:hypothetical protein [Planctomycetota bacterium]
MKHIYAIMAVFFSAVLMANSAPVFAQEVQEARLYDISFLDKHERPHEAGLIGLNNRNLAAEAVSVSSSDIDMEALFNILGSLAKEEVSFNNMSGMELEITATPSGHKIIAGALANFKAIMSKRIEVSAWLMCVDSGVLEAIKAENAKLNAMVINDKQLDTLKSAGKWAEEFELVLNDCQRGITYSSRQVSFTGDYDAQLTQGSSAYSPVIEKYYEGVRLQAVPFVALSGGMIRLDIGLLHSNLIGELEKFKTGYCGDIELPEEDELAMATSIMVPDGCTVIAGTVESSVHAGRDTVILLAHCRITGDNAKAKRIMSIAEADGSIFSVYNTSALSAFIATAYSFPFEYTELNDKAVSCVPPSADFETGMFFDKLRLAVDADSEDSLSTDSTRNFLVCSTNKARMARIDSFMKEQEMISGRMVSVEAMYCRLPQQLYNDTIAPVERGKRAGLIMDAVSKNPELKLASCSIQGFNKHVFGIHRLDNKRIVSDNDVIVGPNNFAYDSVIETVAQGVALQVFPSIIEDGKRTGLDLDTAFRRFDKPMRVCEVNGSRYYQPAISEYKLDTRVVLENNVWDYMVMPSASVKDREYVFLLLKASVK